MSLTNSPYWFGGGVDSFYPTQINDSLRFDRASSTYLNRTPSSGNRRTWTFSAWVKRGNLGSFQSLFAATTELASNNSHFYIVFYNDQLFIENYTYASGTNFSLTTSAVFRDVSAWYHIVLAVDTTQSTSSNRVKLYVNGEQVTSFSSSTYPSQNYDGFVNSTYKHKIGNAFIASTAYGLDGYLSDIYFIDGTALDPTSFGEAKDGTWIPKSYSGSYGTNGFHLEFNGNTNDTSGNGNNWTANNISAHDYVPDSPTNNFATLNPLDNTGQTLSEGNLKFYNNASSHKGARGNFGMASGQWYFECTMSSISGGDQQQFGLARQNVTCPTNGSVGNTFMMYLGGGNPSNVYIYNDGTSLGVTAQSVAVGDVLKCAYDADTGKLWLGKNSDWYNSSGAVDGSANPATGTNPTMTLSETEPLVTWVHSYSNAGTFNICNFGQDSTFAGNTTAGGNSDSNGVGDFKYSVPSGYLALCSANLPEPTIIDGSEYFNTVLYTGNGSTQSITGVGFGSAPDLVWVKNRDKSDRFHLLTDTVRGATKSLSSNLTSNEASTTYSNGLTSFNSDGFSVGNLIDFNGTNDRMVAWNWKAGTSFSNSAGTNGATIATSGSVNTDAGFSIFTTTSNPTDTLQSYGHGLNQAPELVFIKTLDSSQGWLTYHKYNGFDKYMFLNSNIGATSLTDAFANVTDTVVQTRYFASQSDIVGYCWHSVDGYSKVGSYTGGGSNFPFVYTGFRPAFVIMKRTNSTSYWMMMDSERGSYNVNETALWSDLINSEYTGSNVYTDFISNGFKLRNNNTGTGNNNVSNSTYIYIAFAENPFKYANAR